MTTETPFLAQLESGTDAVCCFPPCCSKTSPRGRVAQTAATKSPDKNKPECNFACSPDESGMVSIRVRRGETKGLSSVTGARGANVGRSATLCLLGDLMTVFLACTTAGDRPGGRNLDMTGQGSVRGSGGRTGRGPCAGSVRRPLHNVRPPSCATCSSSRGDNGACDCVHAEKQFPLRATARQIDTVGASTDMTFSLLEG